MDLEEAARALGVHYQTAYRWVRAGILPAVKVSGEYRVGAADVERLAASRQARQPVTFTGRTRDWSRLRDQFYDALVVGDETGARKISERLYLARVPLVQQCEALIAPMMRRIGDDWAEGTVSSARVRVAAGICERTLVWAVSCLDAPGEGASLALVVTPKDDDHRLPALMAGAVLRDGGWRVQKVEGKAVAEVAEIARRSGPALVVVSAASAAGADAAADLRNLLTGAVAAPMLVGGLGESLATLLEDADAARSSLPSSSGIAPPAA